jgi:DNA invertase Pin-like site-specific DNA recombinase
VTSTDRPWNLYLRLSDFRGDADGFAARERRLRAEVARLGGTVAEPPVIENDLRPAANGRSRPASAFKRVPVRDKAGKRVIDPDTGRPVMRVHRPGFRKITADLAAGRANVMCEDLDRAARDPRDLEDLVDACAAARLSARSVSGSLTLTEGGTDAEITQARIMAAVAWKGSADNRRRVTLKRAGLAEAGSYGGGRRPFGYRPDPDAPKDHKTLIQVPAEAAEIDRAEAAVMADVSLKAIARDLRERQVPTVTGAPWSAETLRDVLTKPTVAGLVPARVDGKRVLRPATWTAILERDRWEALCAKLDDRGREYGSASTGNEPRHLCSGWARCHCGAPVKIGGGGGGRSYVCTVANHLRRAAAASDAWVSAWVIARLERDDAATLLAPPPRPGVDVRALREEQQRLTAIGGRQAAMHALGEISDDELRTGSATRKRRLEKIAADLAATSETDPLAEFRGRDARQVWESLSMPRKRAVAALLCRVTFKRATRRGSGFDPGSVEVLPAA